MFPVYLPVDATQGEDQITLFSMVGTNFVSPVPINIDGLYGVVINYIWKIKVTQIDCGFNNPLRGNLMFIPRLRINSKPLILLTKMRPRYILMIIVFHK